MLEGSSHVSIWHNFVSFVLFLFLYFFQSWSYHFHFLFLFCSSCSERAGEADCYRYFLFCGSNNSRPLNSGVAISIGFVRPGSFFVRSVFFWESLGARVKHCLPDSVGGRCFLFEFFPDIILCRIREKSYESPDVYIPCSQVYGVLGLHIKKRSHSGVIWNSRRYLTTLRIAYGIAQRIAYYKKTQRKHSEHINWSAVTAMAMAM
jgi:hypothetical protein